MKRLLQTKYLVLLYVSDLFLKKIFDILYMLEMPNISMEWYAELSEMWP